MTIFGQTRRPFRTSAYQYIRTTDRLPTVDEALSSEHPVAKVKLFNPAGQGTWYIAGVDPDGQAVGVADLGYGPEFGGISIAEIVALRARFGLPIERDLYFKPTPIKDLMEVAA